MKTYTIEEQDKIGQGIAKLFALKRDKQNKSRWHTSWGRKTSVGLFNTLLRISDEIQNGDKINQILPAA